MTDEHDQSDTQVVFRAPTQEDIATWGFQWNDPSDPDSGDYDASGGSDGPDWTDVDVDGKRIWIDDVGDRWFSRHLIAEAAEPLPQPAIDACLRDFHLHEAADHAWRALCSLHEAALISDPMTAAHGWLVDQAAEAERAVSALAGRATA